MSLEVMIFSCADAPADKITKTTSNDAMQSLNWADVGMITCDSL
jgi:hypothetical protein